MENTDAVSLAFQEDVEGHDRYYTRSNIDGRGRGPEHSNYANSNQANHHRKTYGAQSPSQRPHSPFEEADDLERLSRQVEMLQRGDAVDQFSLASFSSPQHSAGRSSPHASLQGSQGGGPRNGFVGYMSNGGSAALRAHTLNGGLNGGGGGGPTAAAGGGLGAVLDTNSLHAQQEEEDEEELQMIKSSVRRLRDQRVAVERLKNVAAKREVVIQQLEIELSSARRRIEGLESRQMEDKQWEKRCHKLSEVIKVKDIQIEKMKTNITALGVEKKSMKEELSERHSVLEERTKEHRKEVKSLKSLLQEARKALETSRLKFDETMDSKTKIVNRLKQEREQLLFESGEKEEKARELELIAEKLRGSLINNERGLREKDQQLESMRIVNSELETAVRELEHIVAHSQAVARSEDTDGKAKARQYKEEMKGLSEQLALAKTEAETLRVVCLDKEEELLRYKNEVKAIKEDVNRLREGHMRRLETQKRLAESEDLVHRLKLQLEKERRERSQWARARVDLLSQFCHEENQLQSTLR